ncbi:MAG TPA: 2-C-methyl-D-erythritol 4-phosphate cytidylyltransferase [Anaerohalosphaeraceae bacterium]|nr:2-C-methyl-D-erythritol 4-phosphate cytidylyltransferase [Anaerohalosphaeraceae bacterium]
MDAEKKPLGKTVAVIVCAAGAGARFGGDRKKPFVEVAGRAAFLRSIDFFANRDEVKQILMAISKEDEELVTVKWGSTLAFNGVKLCFGGAERFETVARALEKIRPDIDLIAVHDAVRCCLTADWVDAVFQKAAQTGAAILACPVNGTLKRVQKGIVLETVDRENLYEAQTPQVFDAKLLREAYAKIGNLGKIKITDDAQLVEALGHKVHIVETDFTNLKITRKSDLPLAEAIINSRPKPKPEGPIGPYIEAQW